jgi:hypothetical protein
LERKKVSGEHKTHLMTADVPLCYHTLKLYLVDREPWFVTGNKADVKTIPALAAYLFDKEPYAVHPERAKGLIIWRRRCSSGPGASTCGCWVSHPSSEKSSPLPPAETWPTPPAVVRSNNRLKEFLALASSAKQTRAKDMLLENSDELASTVTRRGDVSFQPLQYGTEQIIFASRRVPQGRVPGTPEFQSMVSEMGELAAALNCLDPAADVRLFKVDYCCYHADSHQFLFAQKPPYPTSSMMNLEEMISGDPFPKVESPLDERLKLAHKIAEAVFFLHTAGFLHKNITSASVVALRRSHPTPGEVVPDVDDSYLMGFDLIRGSDAVTTKEGAIKESEQPRSVWDFDVFQHPGSRERAARDTSKRMTCIVLAFHFLKWASGNRSER